MGITPVSISCDRITLRPPAAGDARWLNAAVRDSEISRWVPSQAALGGALLVARAARGWRCGTLASFVIELDGEPVGTTEISDLGTIMPGATDWVIPKARGLNVSAAASVLATDWAFRAAGLRRHIWAAIDRENTVAWRATQKAGYRRIRMMRAGGRDLIICALTAPAAASAA